MQQRRLAYYSNNLASDSDVSGFMDVFRDAMLDRGYAERQNLVIEERYASGDGQAAEFAESIERFKPEVIVVPAATVARAVHAITTIIPIVSIGQGDLVTSGLAESLARPGGNVTGLSYSRYWPLSHSSCSNRLSQPFSGWPYSSMRRSSLQRRPSMNRPRRTSVWSFDSCQSVAWLTLSLSCRPSLMIGPELSTS